MLPDLHLLDGLSERSSVSDSVLSSDSYLFGALGHPEGVGEEGTKGSVLDRLTI